MTMEKRKAKCGGYGMLTGICWIIALGILLGIVLGLPFQPESLYFPSDANASSSIASPFLSCESVMTSGIMVLMTLL